MFPHIWVQTSARAGLGTTASLTMRGSTAPRRGAIGQAAAKAGGRSPVSSARTTAPSGLALGIDGIGAKHRGSSPHKSGKDSTRKESGRSATPPSATRGSSCSSSRSSLSSRVGSGKSFDALGTSATSSPQIGSLVSAPALVEQVSLGSSPSALSLVASASYSISSARDTYLEPAATVPLLGLLQAAPLVHGTPPMAVDMLDLKQERDCILASLTRAGRQLRVTCDFCTTKRLRQLLTDGCRMLHYSGRCL